LTKPKNPTTPPIQPGPPTAAASLLHVRPSPFILHDPFIFSLTRLWPRTLRLNPCGLAGTLLRVRLFGWVGVFAEFWLLCLVLVLVLSWIGGVVGFFGLVKFGWAVADWWFWIDSLGGFFGVIVGMLVGMLEALDLRICGSLSCLQSFASRFWRTFSL